MSIRDTDTISISQYEELRVIMQKEQGCEVTFDEAQGYEKSLVNIYKTLAGDCEILGVSRQDERTESNSSTEVNKTRKR